MNWCPALGTVLANEEVVGGLSERGGHPVVRLPLRQWMLRITAYADRLENDLEQVDWPDSIKKLQRDWIGRSTGAEVDFFIGRERDPQGKPNPRRNSRLGKIGARADGYPRQAGGRCAANIHDAPRHAFGATYMVIAPEHPLVARLTTPEQR